MSEMEKFFEGMKNDGVKDEQIFAPSEEKKEAISEQEEVPESIKNRRHRRLESQLQQEREARIRAEERVNAISESERFSRETTLDETEKELLRMYGDNEQGRQATEIHKRLLERAVDQAEQRALDKIEARQAESLSQQREFESFIDNNLEHLEDEHNIDLTSDAPAARKARREFLELVQNLSPKDEDGTITGYADFNSTFQIYQSQRDRTDNTQNKQLSDRSMTRSGNGTITERTQTRGWDGWRQDAGL